MLSEDAKEVLKRTQLFSLLSEEEIQQITATCREESYGAGTVICQQGERSSSLHVLLSGSVFVERRLELGKGKQARVTIDTLRRGAVFGWSSILEPYVYSASAVCREPCRVISIEGSTLREWLEKHPAGGCQLVKGLASLLADRLRATYRALE